MMAAQAVPLWEEVVPGEAMQLHHLGLHAEENATAIRRFASECFGERSMALVRSSSFSLACWKQA